MSPLFRLGVTIVITSVTISAQAEQAGKTRGIEETAGERPGKQVAAEKLPTSFGRYHALLIGIAYPEGSPLGYGPLKTPLNDVRRLSAILISNYGFETEDVRIVPQDKATRTTILDELSRFGKLGASDNLLVFFAGHGNIENRESYWVTAGAQSVNDCLRSKELIQKLQTINARHVLLISDSCYAGGLLTRGKAPRAGGGSDVVPERYIESVGKQHSYQIMTAGGLSPVEDVDHSGNHSLFAGYLIRRFEDNQSRFLSAAQVFKDLPTVIAQRSRQELAQVPQLGRFSHPLADLGEFIFERTSSGPAQYEAVPASYRHGVPDGYRLPVGVTATKHGDGYVYRSEIDDCEMVLVDAGSFPFGHKRVEHMIRDPFLIDVDEVTVKRFQRFMDSKPMTSDLPFWKKKGFGADDQPVVGVTLEDALSFARWAGKNVPDEYQWEYAAAWDNELKEHRTYPWGHEFDERIGFVPLPPSVTSEITKKSPWGCRGMGTRVMEWCLLDQYDPRRIRLGVVRGGGQLGNTRRNQVFLRWTTFDRMLAGRTQADVKVGFRCIKYLDPY